MSYTHLLKLDFNDIIANRLGDAQKIHWTNAEIDLYINEALQTFGFVSQFWKHRLFLDIVIDKNDYDLYTDLKNVSQPYIKRGTYGDIVDLINVHLIENLNILNPQSTLYDLDIINTYIDKRLDKFLVHTGLNISMHELPLLAGTNDYEIPSYILDILRIAYKDSNDKYQKLIKEDEVDLNYFDIDYRQSTNEPKYYTRVLESDNLIRVYPTPQNNGILQLVCIKSRDKSIALNNDGTRYTEVLLVPQDALPYIKWGVLADLLTQDGIGQDLYRSNYCLQRWNEGLIIGKAYTSILNAYINEISLTLDSLEDIDDFNFDWQNTIQTLDVDNIPTSSIKNLILTDYNLFFTDIIPKTIESLTLDCVISAPITSNYIEVREEYVNILLDYVIHLANFKEGYSRLQATSNLLNNFLDLSVRHNYRLKQQGITVEHLLKKTKIQEEQNNRGVDMATTNKE